MTTQSTPAPVYAISEPVRITIGHGAAREVWWRVLTSDGRVNLSQTLGAAKQFCREHKKEIAA